MAKIYYGVAAEHIGAKKQQMFMCNRPILYSNHIVYSINEEGILESVTDLDFCKTNFPAIKIYLSRENKYIGLNNYMRGKVLDTYDRIPYIDDFIQLNTGVATKDWGSTFRSTLLKAPIGSSIQSICGKSYTNITFEELPDAQVDCNETEQFIKYLTKKIEEAEDELKSSNINLSKMPKALHNKMVHEQENRKTLLGALKCKLDFNARRTWAPYITKRDGEQDVPCYGMTDEEKAKNVDKYIKIPKTKKEKEQGLARSSFDNLEFYEKRYGDIDKLDLKDFILMVGNPNFERYQDSYSIAKGIDHVEVEISIRSVGLTLDKQQRAYKKFVKDIDKMVVSKLMNNDTFKSSGLKLEYFRVHRQFTPYSIIEYTLDLKPEYMSIKQDHLYIPKD